MKKENWETPENGCDDCETCQYAVDDICIHPKQLEENKSKK